MPSANAPPSDLTAASVASYYIDDGSIARGSPNAAALLAAGFTGASALAGSGLPLQDATVAAEAAQSDQATQAAAPSPALFGRVPSDKKFIGLPAFYDAASNTLWDGEQGWTWSHESSNDTSSAVDLHTAREPYQQSAYIVAQL